ncbi:MAG: tRNA epoxyqueuosine(34) reductase QueG [Myxococcales bacterium]|nr:tRNA epoxyqueuosine(34) reductase QueG [Myxococcales bacterium]
MTGSGAGGGPLEERIRRVGLVLGLDAIGFAPARPSARTRFLREWVARGHAGGMDWIARRLEERIDPRLVLEGAESIVVGALVCAPPPARLEDGSGPPGSGRTDDRTEPRGRVARYAGGDDYHEVLLERLRAVEAALSGLAGRAVRTRCYVDTGPVLERAAAEAAGLGWIGRNSCLIHPELGSHLMLGVILTDLPLTTDAAVADHCGTCRACLDACPTDAFPEPYVLDATRCLSYTTIEHRGAIPEPLRAAQGAHVFGCDVCQDVCPWNRSRPRVPLADPLGLRARLRARAAWQAPTLAWLLDLEPDAFAEQARHTALRRAGHRGLVRNALVAAGNAADPALRDAVARHARSADPLLREHAEWALARIDAGAPAASASDPA